MPELPEVEIVRRGLVPALVGQRFASVETRRASLRFPFPERFAGRLAGQRVLALGRRAKYLVASLSGGTALIMHLGMTGRFTTSSCSPPAGQGGDPRHDHVLFIMENGAAVVYNDPRRFGFMTLAPEMGLERHALFENLGPEPLGDLFDAAYLARRARGRAVDLKAFLMDQRVAAGLGNIYVSEALHRAGLSPNRAAASLARRNGDPAERAIRLAPAIRSVLEEAIAAGGSTLKDYRHADGALGYFQHSFRVYGRDGAPCLRPGCGGAVRRGVHGGRATFWCGTCQH